MPAPPPWLFKIELDARRFCQLPYLAGCDAGSAVKVFATGSSNLTSMICGAYSHLECQINVVCKKLTCRDCRVRLRNIVWS